MANLTAMMGVMLTASLTVGFNGCPMDVGGFEHFGTSDESGDGTSDDGGVDPNDDSGWVGEVEEVSETGDTDETGEPPEPGDICGDFAVQLGEECDGWNTNFETCLSFGFVDGDLGCSDDCTFDTSGCVSPGCGNGIIETDEFCDGTPYPCWLLGYAGSTSADGMTPCEADCTPNESACAATCEWGQPGCFCLAATPCPAGYLCSPHPQGWQNAPGTCQPLPACTDAGGACTTSSATGVYSCCPGLACVDSMCV
jgi:hypothetical protein